MKILILGATGRVGNEILTHALRDGHHVTAIVRNQEKMKIKNEKLTIIPGNVLNPMHISRAMQGMEVVISALNTDGGTTLSESMPLIISSMINEGVERIITVGTAGILQSRVDPHLLRYQSSESRRKTTRDAEDHHKAFHMLKQSNLQWTIVCPTYLPNGKRLGNYRVERDFLPVEGIEISVLDTAEFTYQQIKSLDYVKCRVGIAY